MFSTEADFVRWVRGQASSQAQGLKVGIGDDAAVVRWRGEKDLILTADLSIEGVHFTRPLHPPRSAGHRALARSLSDIAAMGGTPRFALVSLALSKRTSRASIGAFYAGLLALARRFGVVVIGGDTAVISGPLAVDIVVAGETARGRALVRSGARPGDQIFVSGTLGLSALGLRFLKSRRNPSDQRARQATRAHLYPEPQCALGRFLSVKRLASAVIDLSDGLSTDLAHLCEASDVGARVWADEVPKPEGNAASRLGEKTRLDLALHGGEDYQLLFTVPPGKAPKVPPRFRGLPLRRIGETRKSKELLVIGRDGRERRLAPRGYDHFQEPRGGAGGGRG